MAIIRTIDSSENTLNYVGTLSFLCAVSCAIIMLRFRGFKATFTISKKKPSNSVHYDDAPGVALTGAYRTNRDEFVGNINYPDPPKKITPDMVRLPAAQSGHRKDFSKSTNNLAQPLNEQVHKTRSTPNIPEVVLEPLTKKQIKEEKKLEKNLLDEQKKQAKLAAKEQEKAEKLRKERETQMQKTKAEEKKKSEKLRKEQEKVEKLRKEQEKVEKLKKEQEKVETLRKERETQMQKTKATEENKISKRKAPQPQQTQNVQAMPEIASKSERQESTNTLESISKSSGPPPYSTKEDIHRVNNTSDNSGNITFADDESSWNLVSQHRQQINRPVVVKSLPKQTHLDLNYIARDNSDA